MKRLERLLSRGRIDESRFLEAAQAIANLGVERENIKVFAKALESLDSGELASEFRKPGRKTRGRTGLSNAERARQRAIEERADILSGFQDRFDPAAAIAREQADDLAALVKIRAIISPDEAALFEKGIRSDALKEMFKLDFPDDEKRQKAIANYAVGQAEALELAEKEFSLVGRSTTERERAMSILRLKLQLQREGIDAESEEGKRILANHELLLRKNEAIADSVAHWSETQRIGEQFIDKVLNPDNWNDWGDLGKSVLRDLEREFLRLAAINPLKNALFGTNYPTLGGGGGGGGNALIAGGVALLGRILGFASGTEYAPGGFATVGEHGPENVFLPRGSKVMNARESRRMNGRGGGTVNAPVTVNIDATGADSAELARTQVQLAQLQQSLPSQIVSTVNDARQRGFAH